MEKHVMQYKTVHFTLNGKEVERAVDVRASLTDMDEEKCPETGEKCACCTRHKHREPAEANALLRRLSRIEGQVRGIRGMGQNFLIDPTVPRDIADASGASTEWGVLEIGPGVGPLTVELARRAGKVVSVELDRSLLPVLAETLAEYPHAEVISGDVMKLDLGGLLREKFGDRPVMACANLPYNITTPVLTKFVETEGIRQFTVMIQREVAQRICAAPGSNRGSSFSLFLQYYMSLSIIVFCSTFFPVTKISLFFAQELEMKRITERITSLVFIVMSFNLMQRRRAAWGSCWTR